MYRYCGQTDPQEIGPTQLMTPSLQSPTIPKRPSPTNLPQMDIALLHQSGPPANLPQMEITLLHQTGPLLIDPRCRLPDYTSQAPANLPQMEIAYYTSHAPS